MIPIAKRLEQVKEYYFSKKLRQIAEMRAEGRSILNLGIGSPDLPPPDQAVDALIETAKRSDMHAYQGYAGRPEWRTAIAKWYEEIYAVELNARTEVLPLMGSKEGIFHLTMAFCDAGDEVLVPDPGYPSYSAIAGLIGVGVRKYDLTAENDYLPDLEKLAEQDLSKVKIMWVNYPHMPTGRNADMDCFKALVEFAKAHQILVVNDNPYSFVLNDEPRSILEIEGAKEVSMELNSLSKSHHMAGWRLGMLVGAAPYIKAALKVKSNIDSGMFAALQIGGKAALNVDASWHKANNEIYARRKDLAIKLLEGLGCELRPGQVGMFVWGMAPENVSNTFDWADELLEKTGVFITPGGIFGKNGERALRVSLCSSCDQLREAHMRLCDFVSELPAQGIGVEMSRLDAP